MKQVSSKPIGVAVDYEKITQSKTYRDLVLREYNSITPENALKMEVVEKSRGLFNFRQSDSLYDFAKKNNLKFRAHPIIWHRQLPAWLGELSELEIKEVFKQYIKMLVKHYQGKVVSWDVVNEAFLRDGSYRNSIWYLALGQDYIYQAYKLAKDYDSDAKLYYNDYGLEQYGPKFEAVYQMLKQAKENNIPIDGIGLQAHLKTNSDIKDLKEIIKKFSNLGLEVAISELDVAMPNNSNKKDRKIQVEIYRQVIKSCLENMGCKSITFWGVSDSDSWIEKEIPGFGSATLFGKDYNKKPFYSDVIEALR